MKKRLWDKGEAVDSLMHDLTVGNDIELDRNLVAVDAIGSAAHARMLFAQGLLSESDLSSLLKELQKIQREGVRREFQIPSETEDVHGAIEARLIEVCGEAGRRIHTARSRNDQILLAVRLFLRSKVISDLELVESLAETLAERYEELKGIPLPGYTHMQPAMPSSFGLWLHSWYEGLLELMRDGRYLLSALNRNPLGSGAGFGSSLHIDRKMVATELGFQDVQRSFIDVNNSRGRYEIRYLRWALDLASLLEKWACDLMLYTTREFGFVSLPNELTTGSSIMPQKRNPDVVELLRGRTSKIRGALCELDALVAKLPSSYHRDFQYTKEPLFRGASEVSSMISMALLVVSRFQVNEERVRQAMHDDLFATYDACREVKSGVPFRDAYRSTAGRVKEGKLMVNELRNDFEVARLDTEQSMEEASSEFQALSTWRTGEAQRVAKVEESVFRSVDNGAK